MLQLRKPWGKLGLFSVKAWIDGYPVGVTWGTNVFTVPAGTRQIQIGVQYLWDYGRARDAVPVASGQQVEVHYSPPLMVFLSGNIGPTRMPYPGELAFIIFFAVILAMFVFAVIWGLVSS